MIEDLKIFVRNLKQQVPRYGSKICRHCFYDCYPVESYETHNETCMQNEATTYKLRDEMKNDLQFRN